MEWLTLIQNASQDKITHCVVLKWIPKSLIDAKLTVDKKYNLVVKK
jgi:hypothetical protein